ncbi:hypothetical protein JR316_0005247 [Psilocybe cubensis]|uniref:Uncharacterized protein n=1 Tax=Psilocybe cubensis TaxID=181762 RepID=A0ACB8H5M3_PSICU|nr:hypothetical protein JR316_0005247 [Psilocybe cubensis]KAH9483144.1 hypothetical protein JR316_0005247 [Psilocybe cubensis]
MDSRAELGDDSTPHRTIWTIVRTCLATIIACTWVAVHPNIPGPKHGLLRILFTRLGIMFMVLIAPEMIITWAARQYLAAREIQRDLGDLDNSSDNLPWYKRSTYKLRTEAHIQGLFDGEFKVDSRKEWTIVHSYFLLMGGFAIHDQHDNSVKTLDLQKMIELKKKNRIRQWPPVAETDLTDKSKGDFFSKGVVIVQISWFVVQCIVRKLQRLTLTQLEIATLAYAPLTLALYVLWWDKPLGVRHPVVVELTQEYHWISPLSIHETRPTPSMTDALDWFEEGARVKLCRLWSSLGVFQRTAIICLVLLLSPLIIPMFTLGVALLLIMAGLAISVPILLFQRTEIAAEGDHVPALYAPMIASEKWRTFCQYVCPAIVGFIFGGIHAFAWFASFPTTFEKWAWRAATITIGTFFGWRIYRLLLKLFKDVSEKCTCGVLFVGLPGFLSGLLNACFLWFLCTVFVPARIALLVLPFTSLRALPAGAFRDIDWVSIIPHI